MKNFSVRETGDELNSKKTKIYGGGMGFVTHRIHIPQRKNNMCISIYN